MEGRKKFGPPSPRSCTTHRWTGAHTCTLLTPNYCVDLLTTKVVGGDDPDPTRPSEKGSSVLRKHCDESLIDRSFSLQFKKHSLEVCMEIRKDSSEHCE